MTRIPHWLAQHIAALRVVLVLTLLTGLAYPLAMVAAAQVPGLGGTSEVTGADGRPAGSSLIGCSSPVSRSSDQISRLSSDPIALRVNTMTFCVGCQVGLRSTDLPVVRGLGVPLTSRPLTA